MIIVDTNVVSEFMRETPDPTVEAWAEGVRASDLGLSVVTVEEIERGLGRLPSSRRQTTLEERWQLLLRVYGEAIAVYDIAAARATAGVLIDGERLGRPVERADAQIAGTCLAGSHTLATRNVADFSSVVGLRVVNPFDRGAGSTTP